MEIPFELEGAFKHYREDRKVDLENVKLYIEPDFENERVKISSELTLKTLVENVSEIKLDAVSFQIKRVTLDKDDNPKYEYDGKKLRIFLKDKIGKFEKIKIGIEYEIKPRKGLYFVKPTDENPKKPKQLWSQGEDEDSRYWYPCIDIPEEKITSEVIVKVPKGFKAISNGYLVSVEDDENNSVYHWRMDKPFAPYLLTLVVGEYEEIKEEWDGVTIIHYAPKDRIDDVKESYNETKDILAFFSKSLDLKYPFEKYANVPVEDFIFGGMENITATTLTSTSIYDSIARLDMSAEQLLAHEIAHTWFGDIITCKEWAHIWLNEGFATYFQALYKEYSKGWDEFIYNMLQKSDSYFEESKNYKRPIVTKVYSNATELFDRHTYEKGSLVLHLLRYELGDENFWKVMRYYVNKHKYSVATTEDFRQAIEEVTGLTFEKFFDQFLYQAGHPILKFNWNYENKRLRLIFNQETEKPYEINLDILIKLKDKEIIEKINLRNKTEIFVYNLDEKPQYVDVDPYGWLLLANIIREDELSNLIEIVQNGKTSISKIRAIRALKEKKDERVVECLTNSLLKENFWAIRAEAAGALATIKIDSSRDALIRALNDPEPKVRKEVAKALGEFKDEKVVENLKKIAKNGQSYGEREQAIISLGKQRKEELIEFIKEFLNYESHADIIRAAALKALGEVKSNSVINTLKEYTKNKYRNQARIAAVESLGKYLKDNPSLFEDYVKFLEDSFFRVRITAIKALEQIADEKCIPYLKKVVEQDLDNRVVRAAKEAIYRINEQIKSKSDIKTLKDELEKIKKENEELKSKLLNLESKISGQSSGK